MGVYIKGMEMPISCDSCRIMTLEDTNCDPELFCGCPLVFKAHPQGEDHRPDYCPLVELPPHGRLIEEEPIIKYITDGLNSGKFGYDVIEVMAEVKYAPTIIEAEGRE